MWNPVKIDQYFRLENRRGRQRKVSHMKTFSIQENSHYNKNIWKTEANIKCEKFKHYKSQYWYVINPFSLFIHIWDCLTVLFYIQFIYLLPIKVFMAERQLNLGVSMYLMLVDLFFLAGIPIIFLTGTYDPATRSVNYKPWAIAKGYLKTYFVVDLLSSLPYDGIIILYGWSTNMVVPPELFLFYVFYYLKLIRFSSFMECLRKFLYLVHVRGIAVEIVCIIFFWFTMSFLLLTTLYFTGTYRMESIEMLSGTPNDVLMFLHNTTTYIFSLSERLPKIQLSYHVRDFGVLVLLFVTILIEPFIAAIVIVLYWSTRDSDIKFRAVIDEVNSYTETLSAPEQTKKKIRDYFKIYHNQSLLTDDKKVMDFYSSHAQMQIFKNTMENLSMKVELLMDLPPRLRLEVVKKLKREVLFTGYKLTVAGQIGSKMYIVSTGKLLLYANNSVMISEVGEGTSLGEYQLLADSPYPVTAVCAEISTIYSLDRVNFNAAILHLVEVYKPIREKITERHMHLLLSIEKIKYSKTPETTSSF